MRIKTSIKSFEIRYATPDDAPKILDFIIELAKYEKLEDEVVATEDILKTSLFGDLKNAEAIIGEFRDEAVAFALFFHNFSTFLGTNGMYIEDLYVKPAYRGRGFGRCLMAYLGKVAKERDCGRLEWWCLDWNQPALRFYRSLGAEPMSDWTVQRISGKELEGLAKEFMSSTRDR